MQVKFDENNNVVLSDGKPVYVKDDGSEVAIDVGQLFQTISARNNEAKKFREQKEALEAQLKPYSSLGDAAELAQLAELGRSVQGKNMIDAGQIDELKSKYNDMYRQQYESQYAPIQEELNKLKQELITKEINSAFSSSKYIKDNIAVPVDMMQSTFGKHFKVENGQVVGYDAYGEPIQSKSPNNYGKNASFDEALGILVDGYANKDYILRGSGNSGSGATGGAPTGTGSKTITREQMKSMSSVEIINKLNTGYTPVD